MPCKNIAAGGSSYDTKSVIDTKSAKNNNYNDRKKMNMFDRINLCVDIYVYIELQVRYFDAANWVNLRNASLPVSSSASKLFSFR